uniref:Sulfotransferase domain-containing protein n=1 Tax=Phaeodactylum tricornutum TaxID=2850 RepID=A0A8J9SBQ8_PHATR
MGQKSNALSLRVAWAVILALSCSSAFFGYYNNVPCPQVFPPDWQVTEKHRFSKAVTTTDAAKDLDARLKRAFDASVLRKHRAATLERASVAPYKNMDLQLYHKPHPVLNPLDPKLRPKPEWGNTTFPDISVVGFPKAGTTQLYNILVSHSEAEAFNKRDKEFCFAGNESSLSRNNNWEDFVPGSRPTTMQIELQEALHTALQKHRNLRTSSQKKTVNGCLSQRIVSVVYDYFNQPSNKKFIIALRDPADWLWAVYNFWALPDIDTVVPRPDWAAPEQHYRSPEMFHDLVASSHEMLFFEKMLGSRGKHAMDYVWQFEAMAGRENILYIRNEDLLPGVVARPGGVLDQLAAFTGLDRKGFDSQTFGEISNCNDQKGFVKKCGTAKSNAYEITGGRSMLPETRTLIYLLYHEECKLWSQRYDVVYEDCLNVLEATKS